MEALEERKINHQPAKQLKIYFSSASFDSTDDGDIVTVNSYSHFDYTNEINYVDIYRNI